MSRKGNDGPTAVRIRENQRRSRARRKELIDDLQAKVQSYEAKGIAATQEMQAAARKVNLENARLRNLLAEVGVSEQRIAAYLQSFENSGNARSIDDVRSQVNHAASAVYIPPIVQADVSSVSTNHVQNTTLRANRDTAPTAPNKPCARTTQEPMQAPTPISGSDDDYEHHSWDIRGHSAHPDPGPADCPNTATCYCGPTPVMELPPPDSGLEISCDTAASIIAGMRGDADRAAIRASLGCYGDEDCQIKNTTVLQLMDDS